MVVLLLTQILLSIDPNLVASQYEKWDQAHGPGVTDAQRIDGPRKLSSSNSVDVFTNVTVSNESPYSVTVFYHIFIPQEEDGVKNTLRIVEEQIKQIGDSYAARSSIQERNQSLPILYTTVGNLAGLTEEWMMDLCKHRVQFSVDCQPVAHYNRAFEEMTLQRLHQYCGLHPSHRVIYIHSKGSYTRNGPNEGWRKHMTKAVTDERCLNPPNATCNACGLIFFVMPAFMFRGNMWTAKCDYISQLHPPSDVWVEKLEKIFQLAHELLNESRVNIQIQPDIIRRASFGLDRYSNEHWIGAHPSLIPCDLSGGKLDMNRVWFKWEKETNSSDFKFNMAPSQPITAKWMWQSGKELRAALKNNKVGWKAFFLLPGRILQWAEFYNQMPAADSYVWTWFPHGAMWREAVASYGVGAVDAIAKRLDES